MSAQSMAALGKANEVRLARLAWQRTTRDAEPDEALDLTVAAVDNPPHYLETIELMDLLTSRKRWGRLRAKAVMRRLGLRETKYLGTLTDRQRRVLINELRKETTA